MGFGPEKTASALGEYPTPPSSASPSQKHFPRYSPVNQNVQPDREPHNRPQGATGESQRGLGLATDQPGRRRATSLSSRYPGDKTHRPLDMLKRETRLAYRSPHLRKGHIPGPDSIDVLDDVVGAYHHEGPYDAALWARNLSPETSPLEAVRSTNEEALKATPREKIEDSLVRHRPLDGVAVIPPGMRDLSGNEMRYEEGTDMMIENGGNYKRWPGVEYRPDDVKGKGEPSYSIELALKQAKRGDHRRIFSEGDSAYELAPRVRPSSSNGRDGIGVAGAQVPYRDWEGDRDMRRSNTTGRSASQGLRSRFGSLRRKHRS